MKDVSIDASIECVHSAALEAVKSISDHQPAVWNMPEWNICHHLAKELEVEFANYDIDVELIKDDNRRPDIVVHKRGSNEDNLAVFQVKKYPSRTGLEEDIEKIYSTFFREPYRYKYGIFISVGKLPEDLPEFDIEKIRLIEVYGWRLTDEEDATDENEESPGNFSL